LLIGGTRTDLESLIMLLNCLDRKIELKKNGRIRVSQSGLS